MGRALPAFPNHRLRGTRLPLGERAQILRKAVGLAERHLAAGTLLSGAPLELCRSLLPMWGRVCAGLSARPYFAARREVMLQLLRLATHAAIHGSGACGHLPACGRCSVTASEWTTSPAPSRGGHPYSCMLRGPRGRLSEASRSRLHSAAALRGRGAARKVRSAWSVGRRPAPGEGAWAGASTAAAGQATKATLPPRRAQAAPQPRPGSCRDARCSSPRPDPLSPPPAGGGRATARGRPLILLRRHGGHGGAICTVGLPLTPPPPPAEQPPPPRRSPMSSATFQRP